MKLAFFSFWTLWDLDYSIMLEVIERELEHGHDITVYYCDNACLACPSVKANGIKYCLWCTTKLRKTLTLFSRKVNIIPLSSVKVDTRFEMPEVNWTLNDLCSVQSDGYHFCRSILSKEISISRNPFPDWNLYRSKLLPQFKDNLITYRRVVKILQEQNFDKVFVYNGRLSYTRAVFDACQNCKVPINVFEFGCDLNHFYVYENHLPHDIRYNQHLFKELWNQAVRKDRKKAVDTACSFFTKRRNKTRTGVILYTLDQQDNRLPENFDETFNNIVIYCSSEDEFVAVTDEWKHLWFADQLDAISQLIKSLEPEASAHKIKLYIRLHPNMLYQDKAYTQKYYELKNSFTEVIPCESPVDSYYLLEKASKVVVFGSTIGMEAAFWKNPAILADAAFYRGMNIAYEISSLQELKAALLSENKFIPDMEMVYACGYHYEVFGWPFQYVTHNGRDDVHFKNVLIMNCSKFILSAGWDLKWTLPLIAMLYRRVVRMLKYYFYERICFKKYEKQSFSKGK